MSDVTQVLQPIESADFSAARQLVPLVHDELPKQAARRMAQERPGQTLYADAVETRA